MSSDFRNRLILVGALLVAGGALAFVALGNIGENLVYYWTPGEMLAQGEKAYGPTIRLGGVVQKGSMQWDENRTHLRFRVADGRKAEDKNVIVESTQVPPQMFREGIGVVVEGTFDKSGVFASNRLMVNHSNEYRAPDGGMKEGDWKESLTAAPAPGAP